MGLKPLKRYYKTSIWLASHSFKEHFLMDTDTILAHCTLPFCSAQLFIQLGIMKNGPVGDLSPAVMVRSMQCKCNVEVFLTFMINGTLYGLEALYGHSIITTLLITLIHTHTHKHLPRFTIRIAAIDRSVLDRL